MAQAGAMAPRSLEEMINNSEEDAVSKFMDSMEEIYSHPKDEINRALANLNDKDVYTIREKLFVKFLEVIPDDTLKMAKILNPNDPLASPPSLRKRNKASTCYEDLSILATSIIEKSPHSEIKKTLHCPAENIETRSQPNNTSLITPAESQLIKEMHEMKKLMIEIRKENKDLKSQLNLVNTKIDKQANLIKNLLEKPSTSANSPAFGPSVENGYVPPPSNGYVPFPPNGYVPPKDLTRAGCEQGNVDNRSRSNDSNHGGARPRAFNSVVASIPPAKNPFMMTMAKQPDKQQGLMAFKYDDKAGQSINISGQDGDSSNYDSNIQYSPDNQRHHRRPYRNNNSNSLDGDLGHHHMFENDGYQPVTRHKRPKKPVYGTRKSEGARSMAGEKTDQVFSLFIGGVNNQYSENDLKTYIENELNVSPVIIAVNKINEKNRSYKVTVPRKDKDTMFKPENWEESIIIKPFRIRKLNNNHNGSQHHE